MGGGEEGCGLTVMKWWRTSSPSSLDWQRQETPERSCNLLTIKKLLEGDARTGPQVPWLLFLVFSRREVLSWVPATWGRCTACELPQEGRHRERHLPHYPWGQPHREMIRCQCTEKCSQTHYILLATKSPKHPLLTRQKNLVEGLVTATSLPLHPQLPFTVQGRGNAWWAQRGGWGSPFHHLPPPNHSFLLLFSKARIIMGCFSELTEWLGH